jgi:hypothetical protein
MDSLGGLSVKNINNTISDSSRSVSDANTPYEFAKELSVNYDHVTIGKGPKTPEELGIMERMEILELPVAIYTAGKGFYDKNNVEALMRRDNNDFDDNKENGIIESCVDGNITYVTKFKPGEKYLTSMELSGYIIGTFGDSEISQRKFLWNDDGSLKHVEGQSRLTDTNQLSQCFSIDYNSDGTVTYTEKAVDDFVPYLKAYIENQIVDFVPKMNIINVVVPDNPQTPKEIELRAAVNSMKKELYEEVAFLKNIDNAKDKDLNREKGKVARHYSDDGATDSTDSYLEYDINTKKPIIYKREQKFDSLGSTWRWAKWDDKGNLRHLEGLHELSDGRKTKYYSIDLGYDGKTRYTEKSVNEILDGKL